MCCALVLKIGWMGFTLMLGVVACPPCCYPKFSCRVVCGLPHCCFVSFLGESRKEFGQTCCIAKPFFKASVVYLTELLPLYKYGVANALLRYYFTLSFFPDLMFEPLILFSFFSCFTVVWLRFAISESVSPSLIMMLLPPPSLIR